MYLFYDLSQGEKDFISSNWLDVVTLWRIKSAAEDESAKRFGASDFNDASDAFRHCYWSALMAKEFGYSIAYKFTTDHENKPRNPEREKQMDLHNNMIGLEIGTHGYSDEKMSDLCYQAYEDNRLIWIRK